MMKILLIFVGAFIGLVVAQDKPSFTIMAPNILCSKTSKSPQIFTIRLIPKEGQKLSYNIQVNYEYSVPQHNQRHSLRIWQTIRELEQQFGRNMISINADNKIDIATSMLTPGVIYTFEIQGENASGNLSDVQRYSLDYKEGNMYRMCQDNEAAGEFSFDEIVENLSTKEHSWIKIIGPTETYANLSIILDAKIQFNGNVNEYFIKWKIFGHNSTQIETFRGSNLKIPEFELQPGREYVIQAELNDAGNSDRVAAVNHTVNIKFHPLVVDLEPAEILAGPGRLLEFEVHIHDMNRKQSTVRSQVEWRCIAQQTEALCNEFPPPHGETISLAFAQPGKYQLQAIVVNQDNLTDMETALIEIRPDIVARAKVVTLPHHPTDVTKWIKGQVQIDYVVPKCIAKWTIVEQEGYAYTNLSPLGHNIGGIVVNDFEGNFLGDLADLSNTTVSKLVNVRIPPVNFYPKWKGLMPDAKYKLRLNIECPKPIDTAAQTSAQQSHEVVKSYLDVDLDTNSPPSNTILTIAPMEGSALTTLFKFKSLGTEDKDGPLLFSYGIEIMNQSIILREGFGLTTTESVLPKGLIHTFCKVCDIYGACSTVYGSVIVVSDVSLTFEQLRDQLDIVESQLDRMDYREALNKIFMYGASLEKGKLYDELYQNVIQLLRAQTKRLLLFPDLLDNDAKFEYIQNSKMILEILDIKNNEIVRNLMKLLEIVLDQEQLQIARDIKRRKREITMERSQFIQVEDVIDIFKNLIDRLQPDDNAIFPIADEMLRWLCTKDQTTEVFHFNYSIQIVKSKTLNGKLEFSHGPSVRVRAKPDPQKEYCIGLVYDEYTALNSAIYQVVLAARSTLKQNFYTKTDVDGIEIEMSTGQVPSNCMMLDKENWINCPSSQNDTTLHCSCGKNVPFRIKPDLTQITPVTLTDRTVTPETISVDRKESVPTTTPTTVQQNTTPLAKNSTNTTNSLTTTVNSSISMTTTMVTSTVTQMTTTTSTATVATEEPAKLLSSTTPPVNESGEGVVVNGKTGATIEEETSTNFAAAVGWTALAVLGIGTALGVASYYLYRQNQKKTNSFALDLQAIAAEARAQVPGIHYARFHDENTMRGDGNVYTMG